MELSFIINAVRRHLWIVALFTVLGALPAMALKKEQPATYESTAVLLVSPPSQSRVAVTFSNDPDRYVLGQLSVLQSTQLAERVATELGNGETTDSVLAAVAVIHQPKTDVVEVSATAADPERARAIADAYVTLYIGELRDQVDEAQQPDIDQINAELLSIKQRIDLIDFSIAQAMNPYLPVQSSNRLTSYPPLPSVDQVVPGLVSEKDIQLNEYTRLLDTKKELELDAKLRVTSYIVQRATLPTIPAVSSNKIFVLAGAFAGGVLGLVAAVLFARFSPRVLDRAQAEAILGRPIVGEFPRSRTIGRSKRMALEALPNRAVAFVDQLCVRAEANASQGKALTVVVVGTERSAGATTLALAMAGRYAASGSSVVLVDADPRHPEISRIYNASSSSGIPALLAKAEAIEAGEKRPSYLDRLEPFTPTPLSHVKVLGLGDKSSGTTLRRQTVPALLEAASQEFHVVVIDGGPVLDSASTVHLCQLVDAVVLAAPLKRQRVAELEVVAEQLNHRRGDLLPVLTSPSHRLRHIGAEGKHDAAAVVAGDPIVSREEPKDPEPVLTSSETGYGRDRPRIAPAAGDQLRKATNGDGRATRPGGASRPARPAGAAGRPAKRNEPTRTEHDPQS
ncbi:MAG: Wzz/FepE/Etk N-terminal domain-containing protein [Acidimicrobiia bacterium]